MTAERGWSGRKGRPRPAAGAPVWARHRPAAEVSSGKAAVAAAACESWCGREALTVCEAPLGVSGPLIGDAEGFMIAGVVEAGRAGMSSVESGAVKGRHSLCSPETVTLLGVTLSRRRLG